MGHDVFISHSATDKEIANRIVSTLERGDVKAWVAPRDIRPGDTWGGSILKAIQSSKLMVIVFSSKSNESQQVMREVELAVQNNVVVLPFRVEDVQPSNDMKYFLSATHWLDALSTDLDTHLDHLLKSTRSILGKSASGDITPDILDSKPEVVAQEPVNNIPVVDVSHEVKENASRPTTRSEPRLEPTMVDVEVAVDTQKENLATPEPTEAVLVDVDDQIDVHHDEPSDVVHEKESAIVEDTKTTVSKPVTTTLLREDGEDRLRGNATASKSNAPAIAIGLLLLSAASIGGWYYFSNNEAPIDFAASSIAKNDQSETLEPTETDPGLTVNDTAVDIPVSVESAVVTQKAKSIDNKASSPYQDAPVVIKQRNKPSKDLVAKAAASNGKQDDNIASGKEADVAVPNFTKDVSKQTASKELEAATKTVETVQTATADAPSSADKEIAVVKPLNNVEDLLGRESKTSEPLFDSSDLAKELENESKVRTAENDSVQVAVASTPGGSDVLEKTNGVALVDQTVSVDSKIDVAVDVSRKRTLDEIKSDAEQGEASAQQQLGFRYENGQGVSQSDREAVRWYKLSAEQGNSDAQHSLGIMYELGVGVSQNEAEAEAWYKQAAAQGNLEAQRYLSEMLERQGR